ncbi:MAG: ChaN family lipoprotein [Pseudohongiellaceae bacterium]
MHSGNKWAVLTSVLLWLLPMSAAPAQELANPESWAAPELVDHPLTGRIWDARRQTFIGPNELAASIADARYLLLGEKHDNPDHHTLQLAVVESLLRQERLYRVSFEMLDSDVRERLLDIYLQEPMNADELQAYLMWDTEGWDWSFYGPLVQAVYAAGIGIAAGNITRDEVSAIYANDNASSREVLGEAALARLELDIDESHCGLLPESQFPAMVRVQQARDRTMAGSLRPPAADMTSVLVAGNYHVRRDLGVPNYLLRREPSLAPEAIVTLSFMEVQDGETDPALYQEQFGEQHAFDYLWFTPSVGEEDYCAAMRQ